ncbi:unannotated protein [freshwater metagenome]|uniref:Unannotated protein n=1 Tax=freshwater metagenome TaxID=449393 RepID=A0A6J7A8W4_9ZZZZ
MPLCLLTSGLVRTASQHQSASLASDVQSLEPLTMYSSPSRSARVVSAARSLPADGSL